ncbi:MAG: SAM-dependent methyltransferase [Candidatus Onthomorpha sp.]|nr:SAM-dependent methyltransferase [Bacteroidales bacterium]MDY4861839.1 SAM-dependent methyltransferase [Candidatus Onthomorpha sp.]MCI5715936.1 SAM-dependent methyltransferase [Bacteroidales bacterium]MCI6416780.1 SAM-dependent methyltransferase [Bacteroidales bacterium]MCI6645411.1 SAM-dependent methyltransferase [Bacteroidales bacterium]
MEKGKVFLFPTPIAQCDVEDCLPKKNLELLLLCDCFVVEELRTARRFLRKAGYKKDFEQVEFFVLNEHTVNDDFSPCIEILKSGRHIGVMSEAGLPCVADPGSVLVALCQREGFEVVPLCGPSSLMMALMASGFNGQSFAFVGYLPAERSQREKRIRELERVAYRFSQTQLFIEAPYRNNNLLESILGVCNPQTMLCLATDIGEQSRQIITKSIAEWRKTKIDLNKRNTVFLISK